MRETSGAVAMNRIDAVMERASVELASGRAMACESLCTRALSMALRAKDWRRLARICLPLQESRRLRRQLATDVGTVRLVDTPTQLRAAPAPGCVLVQPPLIAAEARALRESALHRRVAVFVLAREPMTNAGLWPICMVGPISVRTWVQPPAGVERDQASPTRDRLTEAISVGWFESAGEALGDSAIASVDASAPAAHRVEDLIDRLDAFPDHEKLHQALAQAATEAMHEPEPGLPRRRGLVDDPTSF